MPFSLPVPVLTVGLLFLSNLFMTAAWYGHLKYRSAALPIVILISWGIAFFEYCLQVPANRLGYGFFNAAELKTLQEFLSISVFLVFSVFYLGEELKWNYVLGFSLMILGTFVIFKKW